MASPKKRKGDSHELESSRKKARGKKQWRTPRQDGGAAIQARSIEPGDVGIWATCSMGKEGKCVAELRDLFEEYTTSLYGSHSNAATEDARSDAGEVADIEAEINKEIEGIRKPTSAPFFTPVRLETQCIVFFKTRPPVEPVTFVHTICEDAIKKSERIRSRFVKRLTPMTLMGKATEKGLEEVARQVLAPHFHEPSGMAKKFAIRPSIRNHHTLTRDSVIKQVAAVVGPGHKVDLKGYDLLILVEIYQNICGLSVVGPDFDQLKRYNLAEIYEPTPKPQEG